MPSPDPDHRLMARLAAGDDSALAELVARWQRPVLSHVARFLGCPLEEAQDIAQEAFLRVWRERRRFEPRAAFSTWLFAIVLNLCRNRRRSAQRRPALVSIGLDGAGEPFPAVEAGAESDPLARARASELERKVRRALESLPENQRAAVLLRRFEGMTYREIAAVLGLSESAVESLLVRARRALAAAILGDDHRRAQEKGGSGVEP